MIRWVRFALVVVGTAASIAPVFAQDENLVEDVERAVRGAEETSGSKRAPNFVAKDMYGNVVSLDEYRGRAVVLTFLSPQCYKEAIGWLRGVQTGFLGEPSIVFVSVLYPGPMPAFASKSSSQTKIRDRIESFYAEAREKMGPDERRRLENTEIRWLIDWKLQLHRSYGTATDRVQIVLIDPKGSVKNRFGRRTPQTERALAGELEGFRHPGSDD